MAKTGRWLLGLGGAAILISLIWWASFFGQVVKFLNFGHTDLSSFIECIWTTSGKCGVAESAAAWSGNTPYFPILFWPGVTLAVIGVVLLAKSQSPTSVAISDDPQISPTEGRQPLFAKATSASDATTPHSFDQARWNALIKYDPDIAQSVEKIRRFGPKWIERFGADYLALNDKKYLPQIIQKISDNAKTEAEEEKRQADELEQRAKDRKAAFDKELLRLNQLAQIAHEEARKREGLRLERRRRWKTLFFGSWWKVCLGILALAAIAGGVSFGLIHQHQIAAVRKAQLEAKLAAEKRQAEQEEAAERRKAEEQRLKRVQLLLDSQHASQVIWHHAWTDYDVLITDVDVMVTTKYYGYSPQKVKIPFSTIKAVIDNGPPGILVEVSKGWTHPNDTMLNIRSTPGFTQDMARHLRDAVAKFRQKYRELPPQDYHGPDL